MPETDPTTIWSCHVATGAQFSKITIIGSGHKVHGDIMTADAWKHYGMAVAVTVQAKNLNFSHTILITVGLLLIFLNKNLPYINNLSDDLFVKTRSTCLPQ